MTAGIAATAATAIGTSAAAPSDSLLIIYEIAGILVGVVALGALTRWAWNAAKRLHVIHEAIIGRPIEPGQEPLPSMIDRFDEIRDVQHVNTARIVEIDNRLKVVESEVTWNGGGSLKDMATQALALGVRNEKALNTLIQAGPGSDEGIR